MLQPLVNCCCSVFPSSSSFLLTCIKTTTRNELARLGMGTIFLVIIGERSEPLSRVFNDQLHGILYIWWNPYVRF